jgi:hypothetical protein
MYFVCVYRYAIHDAGTTSQRNMFGSRSGSPYGAYGLANAPNGSAGAGGDLRDMDTPGSSIPGVSVYNKGIDYEASTVPSTFVLPSSHPELVCPQNAISEGDFVFVLRDAGNSSGESYETRYSRLGKTEVSIVTVQKLNEILRSIALKEHKSMQGGVNAVANMWKAVEDITSARMWWQNPECVANWAVPFGAALNSMKLTQNSRGAGLGHNIVVSRRASVKNNFFTIKGDRAEKWHTQSMRHLAIQYNIEAVVLQDNASESIPVVQISMLLIDDLGRVRGTQNKDMGWYKSCDAGNAGICRSSRQEMTSASDNSAASIGISEISGCLHLNSVESNNLRPDERSYGLFAERPLGNPATRVIVPIGRVLHSAPRCPTASDCLLSCHVKSVYDRLAQVEIELGCH